MYTSIIVLNGLRKSKLRAGDQYINAQIPALLGWGSTHSDLTGACYLEEVGEAMLSRFAKRWSEHPQRTSVEDLSDLFVSMPDVLKNLTDRGRCISQQMQANAVTAVQELTRRVMLNNSPFHIWTTGTKWTVPLAPFWPEYLWPGQDLCAPADTWFRMVDHHLSCLTSKATCTPDMVAWLDAHVPLRPRLEQHRRRQFFQIWHPSDVAADTAVAT